MKEKNLSLNDRFFVLSENRMDAVDDDLDFYFGRFDKCLAAIDCARGQAEAVCLAETAENRERKEQENTSCASK